MPTALFIVKRASPFWNFWGCEFVLTSDDLSRLWLKIYYMTKCLLTMEEGILITKTAEPKETLDATKIRGV